MDLELKRFLKKSNSHTTALRKILLSHVHTTHRFSISIHVHVYEYMYVYEGIVLVLTCNCLCTRYHKKCAHVHNTHVPVCHIHVCLRY
jgi:hypothetical protein